MFLAIVLGTGPVLATASHAAATADPPDASAQNTTTLLAEHLRNSPANTLVAAILRDGHLTIEAHGRDATGRPVDGETPFRIASMSKSFTAALVVLLAERGTLDLDAPLTAAIP